MARVLGLMVGRRVRIWNEERRPAGRRDLPDGATGPCHDEVRGGEGSAEVVREGEQAVLPALDTALQPRIVAFAGKVKDGGPGAPERLERGLVQPLRALAPAEDEHNLYVFRKPEQLTCLSAVPRPRARRYRPADDLVLRRLVPFDRVRQKDDLGEGGGEAVGEAQMSIRLGEGGRDPQASRGEHDGARDI